MKNHRKRRGQTLIIALTILFLLILLGGIFITMIVRNMQRATRAGETDEALTLALAGLQYAANQLRSSTAGADWRPERTEILWRTPNPPAIPAIPLNPPHPIYGADLDAAEMRDLDPDAPWLDPNPVGANRGIPYVRVANGPGRFLLRVRYLPSFKAGDDSAAPPAEYDPNSGLIHIEVIGRPGEFDPNDPSFFAADPTVQNPSGAPGTPRTIKGPFRKIEAYVPIGLVDQLWWVTNFTNERGPATLGAPPFRDGNGQLVEYPMLLSGGVRSNVDLQLNGRVGIRVYPTRSEGVYVKGRLILGERANQPTGPTELQVVDDDAQVGDNQDDNPLDDVPSAMYTPNTAAAEILPSGPGFKSFPVLTPGGRQVHLVRDERFARDDAGTNTAQSTRFYPAPPLDVVDPTTGVNRWLLLTRDSGAAVTVQDGNATRTVNLGAYGLTDRTLPATLRAKGLFIGNYGDVQYAGDRSGVVEEWQRRRTALGKSGWLGDYYIPSVVEQGVHHPIAELYFTTRVDPQNPNGPPIPSIQVTQYDVDQRQANLAPATGRQRLHYDFDPNTGQLIPAGQTRFFDYPENGVIYAAGSVRVRGTIGTTDAAQQLTLVSGGTIYIEGNLVKSRPDSFLGLLARDYVTLNPTAFTRIRPGNDVVVEADTFGPTGEPTGYHFMIPQGSELDFSVAAAQQLPTAWLHVKHSAVLEDGLSETAITINRHSSAQDWPNWAPGADRLEFLGVPGANIPPPPPAGPLCPPPYAGGNQLFYLFRQLSPGIPLSWAESNYQTVAGSPANFERKTFFVDAVTSRGAAPDPGQDHTFRLVVGPKDGPGFAPVMSPMGQPYWLSRIALTPGQDPQDPQAPISPLRIRIDAVMYAQNGSWYVIPPPFFNDNPEDRRDRFNVNDPCGSPRAPGTLPQYTDHHPFYNEALNYQVEINGAISENMPADPSDVATWTNHLWVRPPVYDPLAFPLQNHPQGLSDLPPFRPNIRYSFDHNLRRMVRVRFTRPYAPLYRQEVVAWAAPTASPGGIPLLADVMLDAANNDSFVDVLPVLPHLPTSSLIYEGNPL